MGRRGGARTAEQHALGDHGGSQVVVPLVHALHARAGAHFLGHQDPVDVIQQCTGILPFLQQRWGECQLGAQCCVGRLL